MKTVHYFGKLCLEFQILLRSELPIWDEKAGGNSPAQRYCPSRPILSQGSGQSWDSCLSVELGHLLRNITDEDFLLLFSRLWLSLHFVSDSDSDSESLEKSLHFLVLSFSPINDKSDTWLVPPESSWVYLGGNFCKTDSEFWGLLPSLGTSQSLAGNMFFQRRNSSLSGSGSTEDMGPILGSAHDQLDDFGLLPPLSWLWVFLL